MTERYDPQLVEAMCRRRCERAGTDPDLLLDQHARLRSDDPEGRPLWTVFEAAVLEDLAMIDASRTHWVAPWYPTELMLEFEAEHTWAMMRDAYLAKRLGDNDDR